MNFFRGVFFLLFFLIVTSLTPAIARADITSGLVGYWNLNEGSGTTAADSSGSGNNGSFVNNPTWSAGKIGGSALSFDGVNQYLNIGSIDPTGTRTLSLWFKTPTPGATMTMMQIGLNGGCDCLNVSMQNNKIVFSISTGANIGASSATTITDSNWHHLVVEKTTNSPTAVYVDGSDVTSGWVTNFGSPPGGFIGSGMDWGSVISYPFAGSLDDVRIYSRALSAGDIAELYAYTGGTPPPSDTTAPTVPSNLSATAVSSSAINLTWTASTDAVGVTGYKIYRAGTQIGTSVSTTYSDTGLTASTQYSYTVSAYDAASNNSSQSSSASATTQAASADTTPPTISSVSASSITQTTATISFSTNESSDTQVEYGLTNSYGNTTALNTTLTTSHSQSLTGLTANTLYHYRVKSKDSSSNLTTSSDNTFTTSAVSVATGNIYIAQSQSGSADGSSCSNAQAVTWFNTGTNWAASGSGKITPGTTVHLCGTISTGLTVQGSGTSGNPVTILFESGAKLSKNHWFGANNDSAIYATSKSYITIDGGVNGLVEATNNGTLKTYQYAISGVYFNNSSNITVQSLGVYSMYERVEGTDPNNFGTGIKFDGVSNNITLKSNTLRNESDGMYVGYRAGSSGIDISGNNCDDNGHSCATVGSQGTNETISNVKIYNNIFHKSRKWSGDPGIHTNLIHAWAVQSGSRLDGLKIYNNHFSGQCGTNSTALVFLEGYIYSPQIYNNVLIKELDPTGACGNGLMNLKGSQYALITNNTFMALDSGNSLQVGGWSDATFSSVGAIIKNNVMYNTSFIVAPYDFDAIAESDYNVFYGSGVFSFGSWSQNDFAGWKATTASRGYSFDIHSTQSRPLLDASYKPLVTDTVARDKGVSLASYFSTDKDGIIRPQGSAWDIGAYEYAGGGGSPSDTTAPTIPTGLISSGVTSTGAIISWSASTDAVGVTGYKIYRGGTQVGTSVSTSYTDSGLTASTLYSYTVSAYDAAGNTSNQSSATSITTSVVSVSTGNIYVAQSTSGSANGSSCSNTQSVSWFNTSTNWASSGAGKITPGTTVHLCGTITSTLTAQGSGTSGNPITILFEAGARISLQPWLTSTGINVSNRNWITIDGGSNGLIEALDNGSSAAEDGTGPSFGHQLDVVGISGESVTRLTIQNLTVDNMYQRKFNSSTDGNRVGQGFVLSGSNILVQNNTLTDGDTMVTVSWGPGAGVYHDLTITGNTIGRTNHGIAIGSYQNGNSYFDNVTISNNRINDLDVWSGNGGLHLDGIIIFDEAPDYSGGISNLRIYNNYIGPNVGTITTAAVFIIAYAASEAPSTYIYNNLFTIKPGYNWSNGFISASGKIYNNTFIGNTGGIGTGGSVNPTPSEIRNNLFYNDSPAGCTTVSARNKASVSSDYNVYACAGQLQNVIVNSSGGYEFYYGLPAWRTATGYDANTQLVTDAKFVDAANGDYRLLSTSPAINAGANLSSIGGFSVDKDGAARPQGSAWDIGAYEYSGGGSPAPSDTTLPSVSITAPTSGSTVSNSVSISATASDNVGVAGVQFKLDGVNLGSELTVSPYSGSWNTTGVSNGSHVLTAVARDAAGNTKTSSGITITVSNSAADTSAPSTPTGITSSSLTQTGVTLSWLASIDNVAVSGYKLYRGTTLIASPTTNSYAVTGLTASTLYTFTVSAYDAAGNESSLSLPTSITTASVPVTTYTVTATKTGNGTITGNGLNCGSTCSISVTTGTIITLTATPSSDSTFTGWGGSCTGTGSCTTTVTGAKSVSATFTLIPVSTGGGSTGSGSTSGGGGGAPVSAPTTGIFTPTVPQPTPTKPVVSCTTSTVVTAQSPFTRSLTVGSTGLDVKALQQFLNIRGFYVSLTGTGSKGNESTYFGPATAKAVAKFQLANGILPSSGLFGPITMKKVNSMLGTSSSVPCTPTVVPTTSSTYTRSLTIGATGTDVKALQIFLNTHGFPVATTGTGSRGNESTYFGPATTAALAKFQLSKGISPAAGYFGPLTMKVVGAIK